MSLSYHLHVGPYFEVDAPNTEAGVWGVLESFGDSLSDADPMGCDPADAPAVLLPNTPHDAPRRFGFDPRTDRVRLAIEDTDPTAEAAWMMKAFCAEWGALIAAYGRYGVRCKWGVVNVIG